MVYYWRRWRHPQRRWRRRWLRRPRQTFRRRRWRRRYRVRNTRKKAKKISIREWQPTKILKTKVKGLYPLFGATRARLTNNFIQYIDSTAPHYIPGGGGFSIIQMNLNALYELHLKVTNWWTRSNCDLPLIRYGGCSIKFYKTESTDYVVNIQTCYPMLSTDIMYMSTQPSVMMLTHKAIFVPCKKSNYETKHYVKKFIKPPTQMLTKWYFQKDLSNVPLFVITATAASFDRYYLSSSSISSTIGLKSLNTRSFILHDWQDPPTTGYKPQTNQWFYGTENGHSELKDITFSELIYLGGTGPYEKGIPIKETPWDTYYTNPKLWGNVFHPDYLTGDSRILVTNKSPNDLKTIYDNSRSKKLSESGSGFTFKSTSNIEECRYNPFADQGQGNMIYLVSNHSDHTEWQPILDERLERKNFPLWLLTWGFIDWQKKLALVQQIDINYMIVIVSKYITPALPYYLFLDEKFLEGTSPYRPQFERTPSDLKHWYPKTLFQLESINEIGAVGPGTCKLPKDVSVEAHMGYKFHFKLGGCPPPMEKVCNPAEQIKYPVPNNFQQTTSLQSPEQPIETFLYHWDERRGQLTGPAAKRIKKDWDTEKAILPFTGHTSVDLPAPYQETSTSDDSSTEEETQQTSLKDQLFKQRLKQKQYRHRILRLIKKVQSLE